MTEKNTGASIHKTRFAMSSTMPLNAISRSSGIDMPGHQLAALATYPELGCTGGPYDVWGQWGVADDVICAGNEKSMQFLEDVLSEVIDLSRPNISM